MRKRDEVRILGEAVDNSKNHRFATHKRQALDEVCGNVGPYLDRYL